MTDVLALANVGDDLDGSPATLREGAAQFKKTSQTMGECARALSSTQQGTDSVRSKAISAVLKKNASSLTNVKRAAVRYSQMAVAINDYADVLEAAQKKAEEKIDDGITANAGMSRAEEEYRDAQRMSRSVDQATREAAVEQATRANNQYCHFNALRNEAVSAIRAQAGLAQAANGVAAAKIKAAVDHSQLNDTFLEKVSYAVDKILEHVSEFIDKLQEIGKWILDNVPGARFIWDHLSEISIVLDCVAIALAVLPIPGARVLAGAIKVAQVAVFALSMLKKSNKAVDALQEGDAGGFAAAVVDIGVSVGLKYVAKPALTNKLIGASGIPAGHPMRESVEIVSKHTASALVSSGKFIVDKGVEATQWMYSNRDTVRQWVHNPLGQLGKTLESYSSPRRCDTTCVSACQAA